MKKTIAAVLFLSVLLPDFSAVKAATTATTILSGGGSLSANYNINKTEADTTEDWDSSVNAFLSLVHSRQGEKGGLSFQYGTNYSYNLRTETSSFSDQRFTFNGWRNLSKRLRFNLSDSFMMTNDLWAEWLSPTATGIPDNPLDEDGEGTTGDDTAQDEPTLSAQIGQEKFWTNDFATSLNYQYARSGSVTLGYGNNILKYDEPDRDNYQRDRISTSISQGLGPGWSSGLSYSYTDAKFDISEDFTSHSAGLNLGYTHSVQDSFSAGLNYSEKNYDIVDPESPVNPNNNYTVNANLGWTHAFSPTKTLSMSVGPSYYHEDAGEDKTTPNFNVNYTSRFEHGSWFVGANGGFEDTSFAGVETDQGISEYQRVSTGVSWQVAKDLSASLGASIRNDTFLENQTESDEKTYNGTASLSYRFLRWFYVSGSYVYTQVDADINADDSEEHRFFIRLGASRELYRW